MKLVLIGAPGSGKGTQGERLARRSGAHHIATGDLLRAEVQARSALGNQVAGYLESGTLVPDQLLLDLTMPLIEAARDTGYILDGFPRSVGQAVRLDELSGTGSAVESVLYIDVPRAELVARLMRRAAEQDRVDDNEDVIVNRLRVFDSETIPLIDYYRRRSLLQVIDGGLGVAEVGALLAAAIGQ